MNILYTCDNNYIWQMGISMISLFESNKSEYNISIYLIGSNIDDDNKNKLKKIVDFYHRKIEFIDVCELSMSPCLRANGRWPLICYARLYAYQVLKSCERVLYLDCDTIILDDLKALFCEEYSKNAIYGVKDFIGNNYKRLIGMPVNATNINGGVLLFNLHKYGSLNPEDKINKFMKKYGSRISYADQDVINGVFWNEFGYLEASYDVMSIMKCFEYKEIKKLKHPQACYTEKEVNIALEKPRIIHFTGNYKYARPWVENSNHPYRLYFEKFKSMSPWNNMKPVSSVTEKGEVSIAKKIRRLPSSISCDLLGFLYCYIRPLTIWLRSKKI